MSTKKYVSLDKLTTFLNQLKKTFATITHKHTLSDISDYTVDSVLSETSTNPVQNKTINEEFDAVSEAMSVLESAIDTHTSDTTVHITADERTAWNAIEENVKAYTDEQIDAIPSDVFIVNITGNPMDGFTADKTFAEIQEAVNNKLVYASWEGRSIPYCGYTAVDGGVTEYWFQNNNISTSIDSNTLTSANLFISADEQVTVSGTDFDIGDTANLTTIDKTIVGAINELDAEIDSHNHDDIYYTETEIDTKFSAVNTSISNITSGSTTVAKAEEATKATQDASGNVIADTYETKTDAASKLEEAKAFASDLSGTLGDVVISTFKAMIGEDFDENGDPLAIRTIANEEATTALTSAKSYTDSAVSGLASTSSVTSAISIHNTSTSAHSDIRTLISDLTTKVNNFLDVDDTTKDQLSEVIALIEDNQDLIEGITTSKVSVSDIVNNLTTNSSSKVLSAAQGVAIKALIDALQTEVDAKAEASDLTSHTGNSTVHITSTERTNWNVAYTHSQAAHAPSDAEANQNAFSNVVVGSTTIAADTETDTLTFVAGSNITLTPDATNDKITIAATNTTYSAATTSAAGLMSASDKSKLDGIQTGADAVSFTQSLTSGAKVGTININGTDTVLYAPTNTDTHYTSKNVVGDTSATSNTTSALSNGAVYLNSVENGAVTSSHKISGSGATTVTTDTSGNIVIMSTDNNTTYSAATTSAAGLMSASDKSKLDGITASADAVSVSQSLTSGTAVGTITINGTGTTLYAPTNTDTKNTAGSTDSSSKLFLVGATSQAANPQTYSHNTAYVGIDGHLYSNSKQVVNLSDSQALTNKTYNGYTLAAACAKGVDTTATNGSSNLITSGAMYTALSGKAASDHTHDWIVISDSQPSSYCLWFDTSS